MTEPKRSLSSNNNVVDGKSVLTSFADLPVTLLEVIMTYLLLKGNIRASGVCRAWNEAAKFVRVVEKHPWVISFPTSASDLVNLFDPLKRMMYTLNLPELVGTTVCYCKDGWLLMRRSNLVDIFFFNPYTRELISLPKCELSFEVIAFSSAPTSGTCTVAAFNYSSTIEPRVVISIFNLGATKWITQDMLEGCFPLKPYRLSNLLYANGHFYCFVSGAGLFDFHIASHTLAYQGWDEPSYPYDILNDKWLYQPMRLYLVEQKGELFLMYTYGSEKPMVYKLVSSKSEEMTGPSLNGLTIFASLYSSETRMNLPRMRNRMYLPRYKSHSKQCVYYSFDEVKYHPSRPVLWEKQDEICPNQSLWIEPPDKNFCDSMKKAQQKVWKGKSIAP